MKKLIASVMFMLFAAACTPSGQMDSMQSGMMCEKCPCCQKMMEGGVMKDSKQCPMMQGNKDGKPCGCCQDMKEGMQCPMMKDGKPCSCCQKMMENQSMKPAAKKAKTGDENHTQHHTGD